MKKITIAANIIAAITAISVAPKIHQGICGCLERVFPGNYENEEDVYDDEDVESIFDD